MFQHRLVPEGHDFFQKAPDIRRGNFFLISSIAEGNSEAVGKGHVPFRIGGVLEKGPTLSGYRILEAGHDVTGW